MGSILWTIIFTFVALLAIPLLKLASILLRPYFSPLRELPGPPGGSWITGHISEMNSSENDRAACHLRWVKQYGHVFVYKSLLNSDRLSTVDPKALNHILANPMIYYKPSHLRLTVGQLIGEGLIFAEGAAHKRQRRIMGPSFSLGHTREMTQIFLRKAIELREALGVQVDRIPQSQPINIAPWISKCTLDIMGLAGFNYDFHSSTDSGEGESTDELARAFAASNRTGQGYAMMQLLFAWIPPLRLVMFDRATRTADKAQKTMRRIGRRLVEERKRDLAESLASGDGDARTGKDLLSLIVKANMSVDVPPEQQMTDSEVMHQIPTFLVAGHETTATGLVWSLYSLSIHSDVQSRLRTELLQVGTDTPSMDELNSLTYFDAVVKECLRLHSPFENTLRVAQRDDIIPLSKPFVNRAGIAKDQILIKKGDGVFMPILLMNRLESIWGPDAASFNPERWFNLPEATGSIPGVWGNQFSFLGGPRSCIGYRFAVTEMKAILFTLVRNFEFRLGVDERDVLKESAIVTRPMIRGQPERGSQMPLLVSRWVQ